MADFITELRKRRVLPAVGVYVASSWVLIEILDRLVERYLLSPYLTDIVFWGLFSLIPAVMLIAWTHGRPGKDMATRAEKVGVPINLIATLGLLITVLASELQMAVPKIYAGLAFAQVKSGQMEEAERSLAAGFRLDPSEPTLWLVKGRLQKAQNMPHLALASVNYALAIWQDADADYIMNVRAKALAEELSASIQ